MGKKRAGAKGPQESAPPRKKANDDDGDGARRTDEHMHAALEKELAALVPPLHECPICCEAFKAGETAMMPCGHSVCRPCLKQPTASMTACLVCGTNVAAVAAWPPNPFMEDTLAPKRECADCIEEAMATDASTVVVECAVCRKGFCDFHELEHKRRANTKDHALSSLSVVTASDMCREHNRILDVYCPTCGELACVDCTLKNGKHPSATHHTALLSEHFATLKAALSASKSTGTRSQLEAVNRISAARTALTAVNERGDKLVAEIRSTFGVLQQALRSREASVLEQVAKLTTEERALLEDSIGKERRRLLALQGGVALTDQLLAPTTTPVRVGELSRMVSAHLADTTRLPVGKPLEVDDMALVVDPNVEQVLRTVGRLRYLRSYGPNCTATGSGLSSAVEGIEATVVVTGVSRSDDRVRIGGDRVQAWLVPNSSPSDDAGAGTRCTVADNGDGTYAVSYKSGTVGAHCLYVSVNGEPIQGSPFAVTVIPVNLFTYGGKLEYDNRGVIYYLATAAGTLPWTNPHAAGVGTVTGGPKVWNNVADVVNNSVGTFYVGGGVGAWIALDLKGRRVLPTGYLLSYSMGYAGNCPRHWRLDGSVDGATWTTLKTHTNDTSLDRGKAMAYWPLDPQPNTPWSFFRVVLTGPNSSGNTNLTCSGLELYGALLAA